MSARTSSRSSRQCRLHVEELESRLVPSLTPTAVEQLFLEQLNDARANPAAYGASIGLDLSSVAASQPLAFDTRLIEAARLHSLEMNNRAFFAHDNPDGLDPGQRITNAGFPWTSWGESLAGGSSFPTTAAALRGLIIDQGVPDLGHRRHLLAIDGLYRTQSQIGIGIVQNGTGPYRNYYTIDTGTRSDVRPFLVGVVYRDLNGNNTYDVGEGLGGVTVTVSSAASTTTWSTGGYSVQVNPGTYSVTMSGGGLAAPVVRTVTIGSSNQRLNLLATTIANLSPTSHFYVTGADAGGGPHVRVFDAGSRLEIFSIFPYSLDFRGGVRVATGDVNGDGVPDIITVAGPSGGPHVRVFDGRNGGQLAGPLGSFFAYHPAFTGGVFVAAGDVNGDGFADIITAADATGGPHVQVFSGATGTLLYSFFAYDPAFRGGVRVAAGDVNGDGKADIITGAGLGGGPHVQVFSGANLSVLRSFFAYHPSFTGGIYVAAGDIDGDGRADIITGAGAGGGPHVQVFSGNTGAVLRSFFAFDIGFRGGVRVAVADKNGDGRADIVTGAGPGSGPSVRVWDGLTNAEIDTFFAYDPLFSGGVFVGGR